jgi:hypothetical protein
MIVFEDKGKWLMAIKMGFQIHPVAIICATLVT